MPQPSRPCRGARACGGWTAGVVLARRYPDARLLFTGGSASLVDDAEREAVHGGFESHPVRQGGLAGAAPALQLAWTSIPAAVHQGSGASINPARPCRAAPNR